MKKICIGILAHVDAGKTTLSEALLYKTGAIRKAGRVDAGDTALDTDVNERLRGITIYSKSIVFNTENTVFTLIDTPGHVDFSTETERALSVLDYAILVINGAEGIQSHTETLWKLLVSYNIPIFIFVNKMDMQGAEKTLLLSSLKNRFGSKTIDFTNVEFTKSTGDTSCCFTAPSSICEEIAVCDEELLEHYLNNDILETGKIPGLIFGRRLFPVFFGSALRMEGIEKLLSGLDRLTESISGKALKEKYGYFLTEENNFPSFLARAYKIARDENGVRLVFIKILCGKLQPKTMIGEEKLNTIRQYSGMRFTAVNEASAGDLIALAGLENIESGDFIVGYEGGSLHTVKDMFTPILEPVMSYRVILPDGDDPLLLLPKLRLLEEEDPSLAIIWNEVHKEILLHVMGTVHIEILKAKILERFGIAIEFGNGRIIYKETINNTVEGIGHFEPLRHYAEVHLLLEPGERGSGLVFENKCPSDILAVNYRNQILSALQSKKHLGVLTGSMLTDVKITLLSGKAHVKHTEGGDFRQAANRAVRQGLMQASSVLLEPYYNYTLELPSECVGRAMTDLERRGATINIETVQDGNRGTGGDFTVLNGEIPASELGDYNLEVSSYTKGLGRLSVMPAGYRECHNSEEVISEYSYDPESDLRNPSSSVFCAHGSGYNVPWNEVENHMHLPYASDLYENPESSDGFPSGNVNGQFAVSSAQSGNDTALGTEDIDEILNRTFYSNSSRSVKNAFERSRSISAADDAEEMIERLMQEREEAQKAGPKSSAKNTTDAKQGYADPKAESYLLVDGYNVIFAWKELADLAARNIDGARGKLLEILCNYQSQKGINLIVVFDAYRVKDHAEEYTNYNNIHVVYTKTAETADRYIERFAANFGRKYNVRVVTSDGVEQIIIRGNGCILTSSREFEDEVKSVESGIAEIIKGKVF